MALIARLFGTRVRLISNQRNKRCHGHFVQRARLPPREAFAKSTTALLVEREDPVRALLRRILESAGYEVLEARDVGDAVSVLSRFPGSVDLLLAEQTEPGLVGPGGLRERIPSGAKVLLTSRAESDACAVGLEGGTTFFVPNPFRKDALATKLQELLKK